MASTERERWLNIEFGAGFHEWRVIGTHSDGNIQVLRTFDDFSEVFDEIHSKEELADLCQGLIETWKDDCKEFDVSFPLSETETNELIEKMIFSFNQHYDIFKEEQSQDEPDICDD